MKVKYLQSILCVLLILLMIAGCTHPVSEDAYPNEVVEDVDNGESAVKDQKESTVQTEGKPETDEDYVTNPETPEDVNGEKQSEDTTKETSKEQSEEKPIIAGDSNTITTSPSSELYTSVEKLMQGKTVLMESGDYSPQSTNSETLLSKYYNEIYVPAAQFSGYELDSVTVSAKSISYYYKPISVTEYELNNEIIVNYANPSRFNGKDPMQSVVTQFRAALTEDGFLYLPEKRDITFPVGNSRMSITVPESMNTYEQLKPLCVATRYEVNQNDNTVTE